MPVAQTDFSLSFQNQLTGALGEDESNVNATLGLAFTCENCFNHNGLVRDSVEEDMRESFTPQLPTSSFVLGSSSRSNIFSITILILSPNKEHIYFKCSHFNPSAYSQKNDHLLTSTSPYQRWPTPPVIIASRGKRHSTLITMSQTICNCGREEQQNVTDMKSSADSQAPQTTVRPMRALPKFDPYPDDPLPLTPSEHTPPSIT